MNKEDLIQEILQGDLQTLFKNYTTFMLDDSTLKKDYMKIRYGINITFDIMNYFNFMDLNKAPFKAYPKKNTISLYGKTIRLQEFWTEILDREAIIRKKLHEMLERDEVLEVNR